MYKFFMIYMNRKRILRNNKSEINFWSDNMAKAGMRRPDPNQPHGTESNHKARYNKQDIEVKEIQGKAKTGNKKA